MSNVTSMVGYRDRKLAERRHNATRSAKGYGITYVVMEETPLQKFMSNVDTLNAQIEHWQYTLRTSGSVREREQAAINIFDLKIKLVDILTNSTVSRNEAIAKVGAMRATLVSLEIQMREAPDVEVRTRLWQEVEVLKVGIGNLQRVIDL